MSEPCQTRSAADRPVLAAADISCGFIGLGSQGAPIARRLIDAGFATTLWARRPESLDRFRGSGARFASSVAELAGASDHVGICVVNDDDVRQVCAKLVPAMRAGGRIAIHSTIHPETCRSIQRLAAPSGIGVIDAPVSGGAPAAETGTLTLMLGGDPDTIARSSPVFESFARLIVHLGAVGAGQQAKLINNALLAANIGLADMALDAAARLGFDNKAVLMLLQQSSGRSFGLEVRGRVKAPCDFAHGAALLNKDVDLLGQVLGTDNRAFAMLRDASSRFLVRALGGNAPSESA